MFNTCLRIPEAGIAVLGIPKCACQSVWSAVIEAVSGERPDDPPRHPVIAERRCTAAEAKAEGLFVFAVVRHPLDRLVSLWGNKIAPAGSGDKTRTRGMKALQKQGYTLGASFSQFVGEVAERRDINQHTLPQTEFCAPGGVWSVDELIRFESLPEGWEIVRERWPALPALPHRNPSARGDWRGMYDDDTGSLARSLYRRDLILLGYE